MSIEVIRATSRDRANRLLLLVEGASALQFVRSGAEHLNSIGAVQTGGKAPNVRKDETKAARSPLLKLIMKETGLKVGKQYRTPEELASLNYGRLGLFSDGDHDGDHQNGLLVSWLYRYWPSLFDSGVVVLVRPPEQRSLASCDIGNFFVRIADHCIALTAGETAAAALNSFFGPEVEHVRDRRERIAAASSAQPITVPGLFSLPPDQKEINVEQFLSTCVLRHSVMAVRRQLPLLLDGLLPCSRKAVFVFLGSYGDQWHRVSDAAGNVCDLTGYKHANSNMVKVIIKLGQSAIGTNSMPFLEGKGQFGSKIQEAGKPHYLEVTRGKAALYYFAPRWLPLLPMEGRVPAFLLPLLPVQLVNGGEGVAPNYFHYPSFVLGDLIGNITRRLAGQPLLPMTAVWKGYPGVVTRVNRAYFTLAPLSALITGQRKRTFTAVYTALDLTGEVVKFDSAEDMLGAWTDCRLRVLRELLRSAPRGDSEGSDCQSSSLAAVMSLA
ncbi:DNA topoisomerase 2-beta [Tyrophagus putrescentiae]|nr:DNA topoisomerase 2-beta [Tyrophagus putrescentiae]